MSTWLRITIQNDKRSASVSSEKKLSWSIEMKKSSIPPTCLMVAPSSTSTACFSFGVFTCTVIFPLPCIWIALQSKSSSIRAGSMSCTRLLDSPLQLPPWRCLLSCLPCFFSATKTSLSPKLSKLKTPVWVAVALPNICALINPEAAAAASNAASRLGLSGTFSAHATSPLYTSFQDTTPLTQLLSTEFGFPKPCAGKSTKAMYENFLFRIGSLNPFP